MITLQKVKSNPASYDQPNNQFVQYNAELVIAGAIWGTSKTKVYQKLWLESLNICRWFRCLCYFYKIKSYGLPGCFKLIPVDTHSYNTHTSEKYYNISL